MSYLYCVYWSNPHNHHNHLRKREIQAEPMQE